MTANEDRLRVLLLEEPSAHREGQRLRLEIEGYEVTETWEVEDAIRELPHVAFGYLVIGGADQARRWRPLFKPAEAPPILVFSDLTREALAAEGVTLRPKDLCAGKRN